MRPLAIFLAFFLIGCSQPSVQALTPLPTEAATVQATLSPSPEILPSPTVTATAEPTVFTCTEGQGRIEVLSLDSALLGKALQYRVYFPPCYDLSGARYPLLIMLHGMDSFGAMNDTQWDNIGLDEAATAGYLAGSLPPMVIVMPNGWNAGHDLDTAPYGQVIVQELVPSLESSTCSGGSSAMRGIGGLSRGGYWAYSTAFQFPDAFDRVGGHSGVFYEGEWPATNPIDLAPSAPGIDRLVMWLDYGVGDTIANTGTEDINQRLINRGLTPRFTRYPEGSHSEVYWSAHSAEYLAFYAESWPQTLSAMPLCTATGR